MRRVWALIGVYVVCFACATGYALAGTVPLLDDCSTSAAVLAQVDAAAPVKVRFSLGGSPETCYAVAATVEGKQLDGFFLGTAHPAVAEFAREIKAQALIVPVIPVARPVETAKTASESAPATSKATRSFSGFRAADSRGRIVDLDRIRSPYVVVYFWRAGDRKFIQESEAMEQFQQQYGPKGFYVVGVGEGPGAVRAYQQQVEAIWPLIPDNGALAEKFGVTATAGYYLLDQNRNVIATAGRGSDVLAQFQRLGKIPR